MKEEKIQKSVSWLTNYILNVSDSSDKLDPMEDLSEDVDRGDIEVVEYEFNMDENVRTMTKMGNKLWKMK